METKTVKQVNEYIDRKLRGDQRLHNIYVEGEISALRKGGPHWYLTLKDAESQIRAAVWAYNLPSVDMSLIKDGKKVIVLCDISPYPVNGTYSLSIKHVQAAGEGDLAAEFRRVKEKLEKEGLFDRRFKKPIPVFPYRVGVITSSTGAAVKDILKIITAKNDLTDIVIFPTVVQGSEAAASICDNIRAANRLSESGTHIDTLIVGRGGGSPEDLAAFNDEEVARAIFASNIPVISAVGHEIDFSISDFVADARAETPTAAADMAVMDTFKLREDIDRSRGMLITSAEQKIASERRILEGGTALLTANVRSKISAARNAVEKAVIILRENDPRNVFSKGYAAVTKDGTVVPKTADIVVGEKYRIIMADGSFTAIAEDKDTE